MFISPIWLLLTIPAIALFVLAPYSSRTAGLFRAAFLTLVILSLAQLAIYRQYEGGTTVVVADRSLSMPSDASARQKEIIDLLARSARPKDKLAVVSFGQKAAVELPPQTASTVQFQEWTRSVGQDGSELLEAISAARSLIPPQTGGRILLLTDGRYTGADPILEAANQTSSVPIDYRIIERPKVADVWIERLDVPDSVEPGQAFMITAWANVPKAGDVNYKLYRGQTLIASGVKACTAGRNSLTFRDKATEDQIGNAAAINYTVEISTPGADAIKENNAAKTIVGVRKSKPILHLCAGGNSGLGKALKAGKLQVDSKDPSEITVDLETLGQYSAVILENVEASSITTQGLETVRAWVERSGGGLFMTGGKKSFGLGGYFRSPVEPIMPVSMELRKEHRKLSLALVAVLDRSGSMTMEVGGGRTKMDLANLGVAQSLEILSGQDQLGVLAVDTAPHVVADLQSVEHRAELQKKIRTIRSEGGGIFVYQGLLAAVRMLSKADAKTKHIVLFADAADAEEPGKYTELLDKCTKSGITCSVIALGTEADCDAALLKDIAKRGQGACYFTNKAEELPRLFTQDTFTFTRNSFLDDPVDVEFSPLLETVTAERFDSAPAVGGYNLTYLRPEAQQEATSKDDYKAPIVATRYIGLGRSACFTGQADGKYTGDFGAWENYNAFMTSLVRWTAGADSVLPPELLLTQNVVNGVCQIRLYMPEDSGKNADVSWSDAFLNHKPSVSIVRSVPGSGIIQEDAPVEMKRLDGSTLGVDVPIQGEERILASVSFDPSALSAGAKDEKTNDVPNRTVTLSPACRMYSPEYNFSGGEDARNGESTLRRLAALTGGKERIDMATFWKDIPPTQQLTPIFPFLLAGAILFFLLETLERRTGFIGSACHSAAAMVYRLVTRIKSGKPAAPVAVAASDQGADIPTTGQEKSFKSDNKPEKQAESKPSAPQPSSTNDEDLNNISSALSKAKSRVRRRSQ